MDKPDRRGNRRLLRGKVAFRSQSSRLPSPDRSEQFNLIAATNCGQQTTLTADKDEENSVSFEVRQGAPCLAIQEHQRKAPS